MAYPLSSLPHGQKVRPMSSAATGLSTTPPSSPTADHRRGDIQGLRAIAIVLVVLDHAGVPLFSGGFEGVDIFFVLSGFVITQSLLTYPEAPLPRQLLTFYTRRIRRITPAASLALVVTLVVAYLSLRTTYPPTLLSDVRWANFFAENVRLTATSANYFIPGLAPSLVTPYWSLAVEEQFYALFPLLFFVLVRPAAGRTRTSTLRVTLAVLLVLSAIVSWHYSNSSPTAAYYALSTRWWELALGALVALLPLRWRWRSNVIATQMSWLALAALALGVEFLHGVHAYPGVAAWLPCGATAALLFTGRTHHGAVQRLLSWGPAQFVGTISYSWYLYHFLFLTLPLYLGTGTNSRTERVYEVMGGFVCALASYYLVENPLRRARLFADPVMAVLLGVICLAAVYDATMVVHALLPR